MSSCSINFSEQKKDKGLNIPSIQVNQRSLTAINSGKSYLSIFFAALNGHKDPHFITCILDSEVRQISVQLLQLWHKFISVYCSATRAANKSLRDAYLAETRRKASQLVVKEEAGPRLETEEPRKSMSSAKQLKKQRQLNSTALISQQGLSTHRAIASVQKSSQSASFRQKLSSFQSAENNAHESTLQT